MKLTSTQMAEFVARGLLRFDACVPESINRALLDGIESAQPDKADGATSAYASLLNARALPFVDPGTPWEHAYPAGSPLGDLLRLPRVQGALQSLVGAGAVVDHHFLHLAFPARFNRHGGAARAQHTHQDSTVDPRRAFDVQLFYFPHAVTADMGGTRYVPGTHLRVVSEAAIARYQNIRGQQHVVCPAGTVLLAHHGLWHGGGSNRSDVLRYMVKIRLCPTTRQLRLWDDSDLDAEHYQQRPIFWVDPTRSADPVHRLLTTPEPWFEADTGRLEFLNRIRLWRYLLGDERFDADYWLTRVENDYD